MFALQPLFPDAAEWRVHEGWANWVEQRWIRCQKATRLQGYLLDGVPVAVQ